MTDLEKTKEWLTALGIEFEVSEGRSLICISINNSTSMNEPMDIDFNLDGGFMGFDIG